ncbi:MAG: SpoIIE family protein phosphatase [Gemmataceae bacterium]|nr:SpoIIE family protein phosphatase [Gemmataceae bacterium]
MAVVTVLKGANSGSTHELVGERIVVGRNETCGIQINVAAVSREHAVIKKIQGKYYIEDLKSRNGTWVNNNEVKSRLQLKNNDQIKICDTVLVFADGVAHVEDEGEDDSSTVEASINQSSREAIETQPAEKLAMLLDISSELSQTFDLPQLLPKIVDSLFAVFRQADRAFIILSEDNKLIPRVAKTRRPDDEQPKFSRKIVTKCIETGQSLLSADAMNDGKFDVSQSIADYRIRSMMCVPLISRSAGQAFGVIQLDTQDRFKKFQEPDLKLLLSVAGQAAVALENARMHETIVARAGLERDLKIATQVQKSFLPKRMPQIPGYEFHAHYESAQEVGGDYYDFIPLINNRLGVMCGDVAGKGVPAALLMAKVSSEARYCALTEPSWTDVVGKLNEAMQEAGMLDRFVTLGACLLDTTTNKVTCVNAGHMPPLIYRKSKGTIEEAISRDIAGLPLGIAEGIPYESADFDLQPGDVTLIVTDGVTEAQNKLEKEFGMDGINEALKSGPMTPKAMVDRLAAAVKRFSEGRKPHDDVTIVGFGRL